MNTDIQHSCANRLICPTKSPQFAFGRGLGTRCRFVPDCASNNHGQLGQVTYDVYENGIKVGSSNNNSFSVHNLNNGKTYTFSVRAINNPGFASEMSSPLTDEVVEIPKNPGVSVAPTSLTLHWDRPNEAKKDLSVRVHHCDKYGVTDDRDVMLAKVIS